MFKKTLKELFVPLGKNQVYPNPEVIHRDVKKEKNLEQYLYQDGKKPTSAEKNIINQLINT